MKTENEQVLINNIPAPTTMVLLPQAAWEEIVEKINKLIKLMDMDSDQRKNSTTQEQLRIPLIQFKDDKELQHHYGLTYTVVRKIANDNLLRSYRDSGRQRYKWTTHEDIMDYLHQIKTAGVKQ